MKHDPWMPQQLNLPIIQPVGNQFTPQSFQSAMMQLNSLIGAYNQMAQLLPLVGQKISQLFQILETYPGTRYLDTAGDLDALSLSLHGPLVCKASIPEHELATVDGCRLMVGAMDTLPAFTFDTTSYDAAPGSIVATGDLTVYHLASDGSTTAQIIVKNTGDDAPYVQFTESAGNIQIAANDQKIVFGHDQDAAIWRDSEGGFVVASNTGIGLNTATDVILGRYATDTPGTITATVTFHTGTGGTDVNAVQFAAAAGDLCLLENGQSVVLGTNQDVWIERDVDAGLVINSSVAASIVTVGNLYIVEGGESDTTKITVVNGETPSIDIAADAGDINILGTDQAIAFGSGKASYIQLDTTYGFLTVSNTNVAVHTAESFIIATPGTSTTKRFEVAAEEVDIYAAAGPVKILGNSQQLQLGPEANATVAWEPTALDDAGGLVLDANVSVSGYVQPAGYRVADGTPGGSYSGSSGGPQFVDGIYVGGAFGDIAPSGIADAPNNGDAYVRQSETWYALQSWMNDGNDANLGTVTIDDLTVTTAVTIECELELGPSYLSTVGTYTVTLGDFVFSSEYGGGNTISSETTRGSNGDLVIGALGAIQITSGTGRDVILSGEHIVLDGDLSLPDVIVIGDGEDCPVRIDGASGISTPGAVIANGGVSVYGDGRYRD